MWIEKLELTFRRNFPHSASGLKEAAAVMSIDFSEVCFLKGLKKMVWCKAQLWICWSAPQIGVPPEYLIEFEEKMSEKNQPTYPKLTWDGPKSIEGFHKSKTQVIVNNVEVYFRKPVSVWRVYLQELHGNPRFWSQAWFLKANPFRGRYLVGKLAELAWIASPLWSSLYWHYGPFNIHLHMLGESE